MDKNLRALRQEGLDLQEQHVSLRREGQAVLALADKEDDGRMTSEQDAQYKVIEARLYSVEDGITAHGKKMLRWETMVDQEVRTAEAVEQFTDKEPDPETGPKLFSSIGQQLQAIMRAEQGMTDQRLLELNAAAIGQGEAIGSEGGYMVQQDFSAEIFRIMTQESLLMGAVRNVPVSGNGLKLRAINESSRATGSRWGGVQGYWVDEGIAPTASQAAFARLELSLVKLAALGYSTDELLEDEAALGSIMTQAFAEELAFLAENSFVHGTGAGQPLGILNAACTVSQAKETGQEATTVVTTNLSKMWSRLHVRSRATASWYINQDVEPQLDELTIVSGTAGLNPRIVTYGPTGALAIKGRPVIALEYCPTLGTVGDIILADWSQYLTIGKAGQQVRQDMSIHVRFTTAETAFRAIMRLDGQPMWAAALTPFQGTNTVSPFVTLATRA